MIRKVLEAYPHWTVEDVGRLTFYQLRMVATADEKDLGGVARMSPEEAAALRAKKQALRRRLRMGEFGGGRNKGR